MYEGRREDRRLLTGAGRYTADWSLEGQAHGVFLRSDHGHAVIRDLDISAAASAPGVLAVLTGAEMEAAGYRRPKGRMPFEGVDGPMKTVEVPALPRDRLRYVGEPYALVVAETEAAARDAAELVTCELEEVPAVTGAARAVAEGAPQLHAAIPGNLCFEHLYGDAGATDRVFADAAHVVELALEGNRLIGHPMEPRAVLAEWRGDVLHLWSGHQGVTAIRGTFCAATGLPPENLVIHAEDVGGAFGIRGDAYPEHLALACAARQVGRPVKWVASRSETIVSDMHGRGVTMKVGLALDADGSFQGIRHDWLIDAGAFPSAAGPMTPVVNAGLMASGAYRIGAVSGRTRVAVTNAVPVTAYRGAARPEMAYAVERVVDEAARQLGIDRLEIRRRNMIAAGDFPYKLPAAAMPAAYDSADFGALIAAAARAADWQGFASRRAASREAGRLRGIGCALFIEPAGGVSPTDEGAITFDADGHVWLDQVAQSSGQGFETVYPRVVARVLGIDPDRITLRFQDENSPTLKGGGAFGSRSMMSQGSVLDEAARQALQKARALAADVLEAAEDEIETSDGLLTVRGTNRSVSLFELARSHPGALDTVAELPSPVSFPSGMHVAEVEIDPETGTCTLENYVSVDDCGTVIDETLVRGQILGGLMQGLGQAFCEAVSYAEDGQILTGSFMDYAMPRADLMRRVEIVLQSTPSPRNRLGAKGVGEAGTVGAPPAAMNAVADALASAGAAPVDMPATPHRLWQALRQPA
ncbi:MAG: xanthine dehydrogenase family protein molybdopterin-binding subunit [Pseudooceanicola sp.]